MEICPCGSGKDYTDCCEPLLLGSQAAATAEALMRSRYSAYVKTQIDYIYETTHATQRSKFNREESLAWSRNTDWQSLEILRTEAGSPEDDSGVVEFIARYREKGKAVQHHEVADFTKEDGRWYFLDGHAPKPEQVVRKGPKIGRNDACPCGSGKKYKKCCGK